MAIYTKTGDTGETGFVGGRISKQDLLVETVGSLDELNANLGVVYTLCNQANSTTHWDDLLSSILQVQRTLFRLGSAAADREATLAINADAVAKFTEQTQHLERKIDQLEQELPKLTNFILPGGILVAAELHRSRTVCRRAERMLVSYLATTRLEGLSLINLQAAQRYLNRLSDYLFVAARWVNHQQKIPEQVWTAD